MKARIVDASTKYFAISFSSLPGSALLGRIFPHDAEQTLHPASKRQTQNSRWLQDSLITVGNLHRTSRGSNCGDMIRDRAVLSGTATMTGSPVHGAFSQSGMRRMRKLTGSFC
jgi:hypothetical protein